MHFLPDVYVACEVCKGKRYNRETLEIHYKGKNVAEILEMTVEEALEFFEAVPSIRTKLATLNDVGHGLHPPRPAGDDALRRRGAAREARHRAVEAGDRQDASTSSTSRRPASTSTTSRGCSRSCGRLVETGNTVVVIEHNLDVIKTADWVIDLGPEGGDKGGELVAAGTPEQVARSSKSYTGQYLRAALGITDAPAEGSTPRRRRREPVAAAS